MPAIQPDVLLMALENETLPGRNNRFLTATSPLSQLNSLAPQLHLILALSESHQNMLNLA